MSFFLILVFFINLISKGIRFLKKELWIVYFEKIRVFKAGIIVQ